MTMATHHPQLRQLRDPQGVQKNPGASHPTPRNTACQGCHARKKRCVAVPSQYRCANCCREGRNCVPRENSRSTRKQRDKPPQNAFNIPLPHGIDHEVPRWSAMYSMFSEMMRLIPPERTVIDSNDVEESTTKQGNEDETTEKRHHTSEQQQQQHVQQTRDEQQDTKDGIIIHEDGSSKMWESSAPNLSITPVPGREEISRQGGGAVHPAFSLGDLDALLRF